MLPGIFRAKTAALKSELDEFNEDSVRADKFIEIVRRYTNFEELTNAMLNELVDRVVVYEAERSEGFSEIGRRIGARTQRVDVYLKYIGNFDVPDLRSPEQIEADRLAEEKLERRRTYNRGKAREYLERKKAKLAAEAQP